MAVLLAGVIAISGLSIEAVGLQRMAAWFTAFGVLLIAFADARAIGTVRLKNETADLAGDPSTGNPAGTWPRLIGQGCLIPGALILLLTL